MRYSRLPLYTRLCTEVSGFSVSQVRFRCLTVLSLFTLFIASKRCDKISGVIGFFTVRGFAPYSLGGPGGAGKDSGWSFRWSFFFLFLYTAFHGR
jgi:hypothetical protein